MIWRRCRYIATAVHLQINAEVNDKQDGLKEAGASTSEVGNETSYKNFMFRTSVFERSVRAVPRHRKAPPWTVLSRLQPRWIQLSYLVISVLNIKTLPVGTLTLRRLWLEGCARNGTVGLILGAGVWCPCGWVTMILLWGATTLRCRSSIAWNTKYQKVCKVCRWILQITKHVFSEFDVSRIILSLCETKLVSASGMWVQAAFPLTEGQPVTVLGSRTHDLHKQSHTYLGFLFPGKSHSQFLLCEFKISCSSLKVI
jgi:hypothetical protein